MWTFLDSQLPSPLWITLLLALGAYLLGSVPFSYLLAKGLHGIDIRQHGSGNVGATNVLRTCGKKTGAAAYALDGLKGLLPVLAVKAFLPAYPVLHVLVALLLVAGHSRSVFLCFAGGKGAITGLGGLLGLSPVAGLISGLIAVTIIRLTKTVSIGSMTTALVTWAIMLALHEPVPYVAYAALAGLLVLVRHRSNIQRLLQGKENRFSSPKH